MIENVMFDQCRSRSLQQGFYDLYYAFLSKVKLQLIPCISCLNRTEWLLFLINRLANLYAFCVGITHCSIRICCCFHSKIHKKCSLLFGPWSNQHVKRELTDSCVGVLNSLIITDTLEAFTPFPPSHNGNLSSGFCTDAVASLSVNGQVR